MSREDAIKIKLERCGGMFFVIPSIIIDEFGIVFVWLFWALAFLWRKEENEREEN